MKKLFFSIATFIAFHSYSQLITRTVYSEVGISVGGMNSMTDITRKFHFGSTHFNTSAFLGFMYRNTIGGRVEFTTGRISGADSNSNDKTSLRNLSFRSRINELAMVIEFHPLMINGWDADIPPKFSPYLAAGIGFFSYKPQANLNGTWYDLQPLRLEGQGFAEYPDRKLYSLTAICFPVGAGVKTELGSKLNLRAEVLYRFTNSDYLDDVSTKIVDPNLFDKYLSPTDAATAKLLYNRADPSSPGYKPGNQRGNPKYTDGYFNLNIKLSYCFARRFKKKQ